jgi:hypothetical protein
MYGRACPHLHKTVYTSRRSVSLFTSVDKQQNVGAELASALLRKLSFSPIGLALSLLRKLSFSPIGLALSLLRKLSFSPIELAPSLTMRIDNFYSTR